MDPQQLLAQVNQAFLDVQKTWNRNREQWADLSLGKQLPSLDDYLQTADSLIYCDDRDFAKIHRHISAYFDKQKQSKEVRDFRFEWSTFASRRGVWIRHLRLMRDQSAAST